MKSKLVQIQEIDRCDTCMNKRSIRIGGEVFGCPDCNTVMSDKAKARIRDKIRALGCDPVVWR